jgi:hypothetical protein
MLQWWASVCSHGKLLLKLVVLFAVQHLLSRTDELLQ